MWRNSTVLINELWKPKNTKSLKINPHIKLKSIVCSRLQCHFWVASILKKKKKKMSDYSFNSDTSQDPVWISFRFKLFHNLRVPIHNSLKQLLLRQKLEMPPRMRTATRLLSGEFFHSWKWMHYVCPVRSCWGLWEYISRGWKSDRIC